MQTKPPKPLRNHRFPDAEVSFQSWSTDQEPLRGNFFHRIRAGVLDWQGFIVAQYGDYVLLQLFSWLMGEQSCRHLVHISELVWRDSVQDCDEHSVNGYMLYGRKEDMIFSYEEGAARHYRTDRQSK